MSRTQRGHSESRKSTRFRVELATVRLAEEQIESCEHCTPQEAEVPFDYILDTLTGCDPHTTDYILVKPGNCPRCGVSLRTCFWRWHDADEEGRKLYVLPGTLVTLKK